MTSAAPQTCRDYASDPILAVVPCLNEAEHIENVVRRLLTERKSLDMRIVIVDGGSTDSTREIAARLASEEDGVFLLDNAKKIQSAAVNAAVRAYGRAARFLIRLDAHADYPDHYCERLVAEQARTGADAVVVSMVTKGHSCFQRAAAAAQNSVLGHGGAAHRRQAEGQYVDHGHHALMSLAAFQAVGGYDETFSHVEDVELDLRLNRFGFSIFLTAETAVVYYPRRSPRALFIQYFRIGRGRARNFLKHRSPPKLRQIILVAIAPALVLTIFAPLSWPFAVPTIVWIATCLAYGVLLGLRAGDICAAAAGVAAMATQAGWSFGFLTGVFANMLARPTTTYDDNAVQPRGDDHERRDNIRHNDARSTF